MHLRQHGFIYSACRLFTKSNERIQKFIETRDSRYIYQNEPDKACFQHDMAYGDFKDLSRRTASDKLLRDKAFNLAKNSKYDRHQGRLASVVYKLVDKRSSGANTLCDAVTWAQSDTLATRDRSTITNKIMPNQQLA